MPGVVRECSCSKCDWTVPMIVLGWDVISVVFGSRMVVRLGWSLAMGWRPAEILRFAWYRFGLFLYRTSSCFRSLSVSFLLALLIIDIWLYDRGQGCLRALGFH